MSDYATARCLKNTDELQDGYLHVHKIIRNAEERTYVLRWTIRDYRFLAFGIPFNAHHIRIGKTLHRLRILKHFSKVNTFQTNIKFVCVHLGLTPSPVGAQVAITILQSDEEEIESTPCTGDYLPHLMHRKCYSSFVEPPVFSGDFNPTVICRITIQRKDGEVHLEKSSSISNDLRDLFLDGKFSDITILVGDAKFQAHRAILAARSPVLDVMLQHEMEEKREGILEILDFDSDSVYELLYFLYTGRTRPLSVDSALPLLQLADKYYVQELKSDLEEFLRSNLSVSQVLNILVYADMCNSEDLKNEALGFVVYNLGKVMKRSEWTTFRTRHDLVDEIMYLFSDIYATDF